MTHWIILRTSGAKTLPLANSLNAAGMDVWTPVEKEKDKRDKPILPTFLFARAAHMADLISIIAQPISHHPSFHLFRYAGRNDWRVSEMEIAALRLAEARSARIARKIDRRKLVMGQRIKGWGAFAGMAGEIVKLKKNGKSALIAFGGGFQIEIDSCDMPESLVSNDSRDLGAAA